MASSPHTNPPPFATAVPIEPLKVPEPEYTVQTAQPMLQPVQPVSAVLDDNQIQQLMAQGYTRGLAKSVAKAKQAFALRIWIIDNSGSMNQTDGHRIVETRKKSDVKMVACSRWEEIRECINYHINLASLVGAPTNFRLLNDPGLHVGPQRFGVAEDPTKSPHDAHEALSLMAKVRPGGCTPLVDHVLDIHRTVTAMTPQLRASGQRVAVIIATDGLPTDPMGYGGAAQKSQFVNALRMLEGLPVWVVVRLCTDEEEVVNFYNDLDGMMELSIEVLDDFSGEAEEVHGCNPWLNYALPLHRLREMGYHDRIFDMLDERLLTKSEVRDFCTILFGEDEIDGMPDPSVEFESFSHEMDRLLKKESSQWDPMKKKMRPWIDLKKLAQVHGDSSCIIL